MEDNQQKYDENLDTILASVYYENKKESFQAFHVLILGIIFALTCVFFFIFPRSTVSESENRNLQEFPVFSFDSLINNKYTSDISAYFSDTVPYRDKLMELSSFVSDLSGIRFDDVKIHGAVINNTSENINTTSEPIVTQPSNIDNDSSTTTIPPKTDEPQTSIHITNDQIDTSPEDIQSDEFATIANNGILVSGTRGLMLYGGSLPVGEKYALAINEYKKALGNNVNVYSMVIPTGVEFYCPSNYRYLTASQLDNINNIISHLDEVKAVNIYTALSEHKDEPIFFRTDHHWAPLGAYYAAQEFSEISDTPFVDISSYEKRTVGGYVGTLYSYSNDIKLKQNPEDFVYYVSQNDYSVTYYNYSTPLKAESGPLFISYPEGSSMLYCTFFGGDSKVAHIKTDVNNNRKLAVFKDSYGNALVPFLLNSFEEIYVIDMRYFPHNAVDYLKEHGITDVLFANNAFHATTASTVTYYNTLRTQADYSASLQSGTTAHQTTQSIETTTKPSETTTKPSSTKPQTTTPKPSSTKKTTTDSTTKPVETTDAETKPVVTTVSETPEAPITTPIIIDTETTTPDELSPTSEAIQ